MAITNYGELSTSLQNWLELVSDGTLSSDRIAEIVDLGESRLNRDLKTLRPMRKSDTSLTATASSNLMSIAGITDYRKPIALALTTDGPDQWLKPAPLGSVPRHNVNGYPHRWWINNTDIEFDRPADQAHTFRFDYYAGFALDATDNSDNNWLLTNHPDIYLYACLSEAGVFLQDPESVAGYETILGPRIRQLNRTHGLELWQATSQIDPALSPRSGRSYNVNADEFV